MCSVGLSLIFGTTGLTNFAHGEMVTFGAHDGVPVQRRRWAGSISCSRPRRDRRSAACSAYLLDLVLWRAAAPQGIGLVSQLVVSVGLAILLRNFYLLRFGGRTKPFADFNDQTGDELRAGRHHAARPDHVLLSLVVLVAVALVLQRTRFGKATRAVSDNPDLAVVDRHRQPEGHPHRVVRRRCARRASAASSAASTRRVSPDMGSSLLFLMFAGITLGGLGSAFGALVGGFIVGLFVELLHAVRRADRAEERAAAGGADPDPADPAAGHPRPTRAGGLRMPDPWTSGRILDTHAPRASSASTRCTSRSPRSG